MPATLLSEDVSDIQPFIVEVLETFFDELQVEIGKIFAIKTNFCSRDSHHTRLKVIFEGTDRVQLYQAASFSMKPSS